MDFITIGLAFTSASLAPYWAYRLVTGRIYTEVVVKRTERRIPMRGEGVRPFLGREVSLDLVHQTRSGYRNIVLREKLIDREVIPPSVVQHMDTHGAFGGWKSRFSSLLEAHHLLEARSAEMMRLYASPGRSFAETAFDEDERYQYHYPQNEMDIVDAEFVDIR